MIFDFEIWRVDCIFGPYSGKKKDLQAAADLISADQSFLCIPDKDIRVVYLDR